jgi:3-phenylpropionate/trans-cinnamate dioxygenase ferredoxin reductase subunit
VDAFKYLIIGTGMTADAAARGIREMDPAGSIGMIGIENDRPYNRPPLSKGLWKGKPLDSIWRRTEQTGAQLHLGRKVVALDPEKHLVNDIQGNTYSGEKILIATGGRPRRLPFGGENVIYYRSLSDYKRLREATQTGQHFAVIGNGFIGAEIAAALSMNGKKVTMLFHEDGISARLFPTDLVKFLNDFYQKKGVEILAGELVGSIDERGGRFFLRTDNGREIVADGVVAGLGIERNLDLAHKAGLKVEKGIAVDEYLLTSKPNIYAAGDVAEFFNPALGKRIIVEHEDNANSMGRQAGRNMAGANEPYHHLPFFYSDLFELGYEAVGEIDSHLTTVADWEEPYQKGIVYYLEGGRVRGVLLWNVWKQVEAARKLIAEPGPFTAGSLKHRLPA